MPNILKTQYYFYNSVLSKERLQPFSDVILAFTYVVFLLIFSHVDLIINWINDDKTTFTELVLNKHAHMASLLMNIGLLLFMMIDIAIILKQRMSSRFSLIICLSGVISCVLMTMCSFGHLDHKLFARFGGIDYTPLFWIMAVIFTCSLVKLKHKSLTTF